MSVRKKALAAASVCAAGAIAALGVGIFGAYPRYKTERTPFSGASVPDSPTVTVMSANVRCFSPTDLFKRSWFFRAPLLLEDIRAAEPDIIGFQEVTFLHEAYLNDVLRGYGHTILYRDESRFSEGCPIYYRTDRFTAEETGGFWLSETPGVMSKSWGAAFCRVCSYAVLTENATGKRFAVFNTHLDHVSEEARIRGIDLVRVRIAAFGDLPAVLMGDLNATEGSETYRSATERFYDAKYRTADSDTGATYQGFGKAPDGGNIDYFMVSKTGVSVAAYRVIRTTYGGAYVSDHFPILLRIEIE